MNAAAFWSEGLRTHGHTGWADPVIYGCDDLDRVERASRLLLGLGFTVCGYDPFVKSLLAAPRIVMRGVLTTSCSRDAASIWYCLSPRSITFEDDELAAGLDLISSLLTADGTLLLFNHSSNPLKLMICTVSW